MPSIENIKPEPEPEVSMPSVLRKRNTVRFKHDAIITEPVRYSKPNRTNTMPVASSNRQVPTRQTSVLKMNRKSSGSVKKRTAKKVVFNGTFPIDDPISSRFDDSNDDDDSCDDDENDDDDDEDDDDDDHDTDCCDRGESIDDGGLIVDRKLNFNRMMNECERSFAAFDELMASRNLRHPRNDCHVND